MQNQEIFKKPVWEAIFSMGIPSLISVLVMIIYNMADMYFIGFLNDYTQVAAVSLIMPVFSIMTAVSMLLGNGGCTLIAQALGAGEKKRARSYMSLCIWTAILLGVIIAGLIIVFSNPLLKFLGTNEEMWQYARNYMLILAVGSPAMLLNYEIACLVRGEGAIKPGLIANFVSTGMNILLDPVLILGVKMGVSGAALATVLSQGLSCLWVLSFLFGKKTFIRIRRCNLRLHAKVILPCLALGSALFVMQASESVISVCFNTSLLKYGGDLAVGAMTILTSVMQFAMLPLQGLAQGAQPIISYNYGAGNSNRVRRAYRLLLTCSVCYAMLFCLLIQLFPGVFAAIFTSNAELLAFTKPMLRIYTLALGLFGIQIACQMTFTALGNAKASIIVAVMRKFILLLPLIYMMPHLYTADLTKAVFMAEPVADVLAVAFTGVLFFFEFRKALRAMPKSEKKS